MDLYCVDLKILNKLYCNDVLVCIVIFLIVVYVVKFIINLEMGYF